MAIQYVPQGDEFGVSTQTAGNQQYQRITSLADGGFVVTWWSSPVQNAGSSGIFCQVFGGDGSRVGNEFRVNTDTVGNVGTPFSLADGGFVVTWDSYDVDRDGVYGQVFDGDGSRVGSEFRVNTYTTGWQNNQRTTSLADGGFVVTWLSSNGQDSDGHGVYGQVFDGDGSPVGSEFCVNTYTTDYQGEQHLTVTSRKVVGLFPEHLGFQFVPVLHHLQGCLCAQG